jgi:hypothetical protein
VQPSVKFRQFADIKDAAVQGKGKGDTFHWNVYSDVTTRGTKLVETTTIPKTNFTITAGHHDDHRVRQLGALHRQAG